MCDLYFRYVQVICKSKTAVTVDITRLYCAF